MSKKDLSLKKYNIGKHEYRELYYFCLQYPEWKHQLSTLTTVRPQKITGMPSGRNGKSDVTALAAMKRAELKEKCTLIEKTVKQAAPYIYRDMLRAVTEGVGWDKLCVDDEYGKRIKPRCSKKQFFEQRRKFYYLLSQNR